MYMLGPVVTRISSSMRKARTTERSLQNQEKNPGAELDHTKDTLCVKFDCEDNTSMESMVVWDGPGCELRVSLPSFNVTL
jgi:hypothetical protein